MNRIRDIKNIDEKLKVLGHKDRLEMFLMIASANQGVLSKDLAVHFEGIQKPNLTSHIDKLKHADLVKFSINKKDKREKPLFLKNDDAKKIAKFLESK